MPFVQFLLLLLLLCPLLYLFNRLKGLFLLVYGFHFKPFLLHLVRQQALLVFLILVLKHVIAHIPVVLFGNKSHFLLLKALLVQRLLVQGFQISLTGFLFLQISFRHLVLMEDHGAPFAKDLVFRQNRQMSLRRRLA
jgi:hypothetical protein